jgi:hypothetical protein
MTFIKHNIMNVQMIMDNDILIIPAHEFEHVMFVYWTQNISKLELHHRKSGRSGGKGRRQREQGGMGFCKDLHRPKFYNFTHTS